MKTGNGWAHLKGSGASKERKKAFSDFVADEPGMRQKLYVENHLRREECPTEGCTRTKKKRWSMCYHCWEEFGKDAVAEKKRNDNLEIAQALRNIAAKKAAMKSK